MSAEDSQNRFYRSLQYINDPQLRADLKAAADRGDVTFAAYGSQTVNNSLDNTNAVQGLTYQNGHIVISPNPNRGLQDVAFTAAAEWAHRIDYLQGGQAGENQGWRDFRSSQGIQVGDWVRAAEDISNAYAVAKTGYTPGYGAGRHYGADSQAQRNAVAILEGGTGVFAQQQSNTIEPQITASNREVATINQAPPPIPAVSAQQTQDIQSPQEATAQIRSQNSDSLHLDADASPVSQINTTVSPVSLELQEPEFQLSPAQRLAINHPGSNIPIESTDVLTRTTTHPTAGTSTITYSTNPADAKDFYMPGLDQSHGPITTGTPAATPPTANNPALTERARVYNQQHGTQFSDVGEMKTVQASGPVTHADMVRQVQSQQASQSLPQYGVGKTAADTAALWEIEVPNPVTGDPEVVNQPQANAYAAKRHSSPMPASAAAPAPQATFVPKQQNFGSVVRSNGTLPGMSYEQTQAAVFGDRMNLYR
jgi:hypothetical protein